MGKITEKATPRTTRTLEKTILNGELKNKKSRAFSRNIPAQTAVIT